jgi:hypothetical protein
MAVLAPGPAPGDAGSVGSTKVSKASLSTAQNDLQASQPQNGSSATNGAGAATSAAIAAAGQAYSGIYTSATAGSVYTAATAAGIYTAATAESGKRSDATSKLAGDVRSFAELLSGGTAVWSPAQGTNSLSDSTSASTSQLYRNRHKVAQAAESYGNQSATHPPNDTPSRTSMTA